jgi:septum formation protein
VLGKPDGAAGAAAMLRRLSGRAHEVLTGVALHAAGGCRDRVQSTRVVFRALSPDDVAWYVATGESADKAGAYSIQGRASRFVTRIEGSYTNVVGLPVELVDGLLREHVAGGDPAGGERSPPGPHR